MLTLLVRRLRLPAAVGIVLLVAAATDPSSPPAPAPTLVADIMPAPAKPVSPVTLAFAGDVHFEGPLRAKLAGDRSGMFTAVAPLLRAADIAVVNLETAITRRGTPAKKEYTFRTPPAALTALRSAGIDAASMANNHGLDYGRAGLTDSLAAAKAARFPIIGIGRNEAEAYRPYRAVVRGQRIAVIAATQVLDSALISSWTAGPRQPGLASAKDVPRLVKAVAAARKNSDTVVVYLHWGTEGMQCPNAGQRSLMGSLVAAGADIIVGSHAHVLQGAGRAGSAFVAYGLGNFAFYARSGPAIQTGVLTLTVTGRHVSKYTWAPAVIAGGVPQPLTGVAAAQAKAGWQALRGCAGLTP